MKEREMDRKIFSFGLSKKAKEFNKKISQLRKEIKRVIVGQDEVLDKLFLGLLCDAHILLEGLPGLAKTLMVHTLARITYCSFRRIQFTPDLLPADIIGTKVYNQKKNEFYTQKGPIFENFILADEINRAPPKVQSALLEAMQERQVTIAGETFKLPKPFFVLATQNPIETEGTYPLPEAQVDRFMFKVLVKYPKKDEEIEIMNRMTTGKEISIRALIKPEEIIKIQNFIQEKIYVDKKIKSYVADLVFATRNPKNFNLGELENLIQYGASPRASIYLINGAKANAFLNGRSYVVPDDVKEIAYDTLRHRILLTYEAEAEEVEVEEVIKRILENIKSP
jgi:MoxR-like ATPase